MKPSRIVVFAAVALCSAQVFAANTHTVTFRKMDGTVLMQTNVVHGANASSLAPAGPDESANGLAFSRWDHADWLACITNDVTCWALYEATTAKSASTSIASQHIADRETPYSLDEYFQMYNNLAWSDEFSGNELSVSSSWAWNTGGKNWQYNTEEYGALQTYTEGPNQEVSDGTLKIICKHESSAKITSTKIRSKNRVQFKLGRCEIRAKITKALGAFPAFWLMGTGGDDQWPWCGELDIMEQVSGKDWIAGTMHLPAYPKSTGNQAVFSNQGLAAPEDGVQWGDGFHRIGAILSEREVVWYVDDHIFQRQDIRDSRYDIIRDHGWYILLNYAFGGGWSGVTNLNQSAAVNFTREDFEIDYCRIFTNATANNTVEREDEPADALLTTPVKATIWRGWQMNWGKSGANYYQNHLVGQQSQHIRKALREYFARDNGDIVMFHPRTAENTGDTPMPFDVPGYTSLDVSPLSGMTTVNTNANEKMRSTVIFNAERFSRSNSSINALQLSSDPTFTNCAAVVAELVERETGAKVKVVSAYVTSTNGVDNAGSVVAQGFSTLMSKLDAMKDERVILLLQGDDWNKWYYLDRRVNSELKPSFSRLGQYTSAHPAYQSAWVTANHVASAENPAPLTLGTSNSYTNQAYCATVQFDAEPAAPVVRDPVLVVTVNSGVTNTLSAITNVTAATWITNVVKRGAGTLVASGMPSGFSGTISVEAGVWQGGASASDFGEAGTVIDVKDGASLVLADAGGASPAANVLSDKTVNLYGAKSSGALGKIHVSGTDTAVLGENVAINLKDADSVLYLGSSNWDTAKLKSGIVNLGGRKLTIQAPWKRFQTGATFTNGGVVTLLNVALYAEWLVPAFDGTGTLESNYAVDFPNKVNSQGWTLKSTGSAYGNVQRMPSENDFPGWEGPAQFTGSNAKLATYTGSSASISNTVFNLKGAISGSGTLSVGTGWLNLHNATNTYSGAVFVNGQCVGAKATILPGSGGIGLWNGAACFPNASLITFTNTARLAFMDNTKCSVGNVKFLTLAGETQSISGGVHTARSTIAGITKDGAGTLVVDSPAQITGLADIQAGTLKIAYCSNTNATTQEAMLEPMPQFSSLKFASGTVLDLSDNVGMVLSDLEGAPCVTNSGMLGIGGKWKLDVPGEKLLVTSELATVGGAGGVLCFLPGATFDLADEAAFRTAASGADGLLVAEAAWILDPEQLSGQVALPAPVSTLGAGWLMAIGKDSAGNDGRGLYLRYLDPSASGYAAWVAEKGISGSPDEKYNGIERGVRYAFDIAPESATVGDPIIQIVRDAAGNPVVEARDLAEGRSDVTFGILATENLTDWSQATLVPMEKFNDGYWKPSESADATYTYPAKMFFKYKVEVK